MYEYENGVKAVYVVNSKSKEMSLDVVLLGGSYFEDQIGVPHGTAHLTEHMLENPNKHFRTRATLERFVFGTRKYPLISRNAMTSHSLISFVSSSQIKGTERLLNLLNKRFSLTTDFLRSNFQKEKNVVLSEEKRYPKNNRNKSIHYSKFVNQGKYKEFSRKVIGEEKTIKNIQEKDISKYWKTVFVSNNIILCIQTGKEFNKENWMQVEKFVENVPTGFFKTDIKSNELRETYDIGHFYDPDYKNTVGIDISFLEKNRDIGIAFNKNEYFKKKLEHIYLSLIPNVAFLTLRDKFGLIYSMNSFYEAINWHWNIFGFSVSTSKQNLLNTVNELYNLTDKYVPQYLASREGKLWLESQISKYLYPLNVEYNNEYALNIAQNIILGIKYVWEFKKSKEAITKIKIRDIYDINLQNHLRPKRIWSYSSYKGNEIEKIIQKSLNRNLH